VRGQVDLWEVRLRHVLSHEQEGRNEVLDQARCCPMQGAQGWTGPRREPCELL